MGRVDGKVALISGGAGGMGAEDARLLVEEGAKVVIGDILDDQGKALADEIGDSARYVHLDVTQPDQWDAAVATAIGEFGKLNVLVNNAGTVALGPLKNFDLAKWQKVIDVNLTGTFLGMRVAVEPMTAAGGRLDHQRVVDRGPARRADGAPLRRVQVGGARPGQVGGIGVGAVNIRVNSIHPGFIRTPMTAHLPEDMVTIPLGRPGEVREVATFVLFLASDESSYATGSEFVMDGGLITDVNHKEF